MESMVEKVKSIQKEYNKIAKGSLSLSDPSEVDVLVEYISQGSVVLRFTSAIRSEEYRSNHRKRLIQHMRKW